MTSVSRNEAFARIKYGGTKMPLKDLKKKSEITEDDLKAAEKDIQTLTDKYIKEIDGITAAKEKEIMEI